MNDDGKQSKIGVVLSYVAVFISVFSGIVFTPLMIQMLGKDQYGLYELIGSVAGYMSVLNFGFGAAIIKYVAQCREEKNKKKEATILAVIMRMYVISAIFVLLIGTLIYVQFANIFSNSLTADEISQGRTMLVVAMVDIAISIPGGLFNSYVSAYQRYGFAKGIVLVQNVSKMIIIVIALFCGCDALALTLIGAFTNLAGILCNMIYSIRILHIEIKNYHVSNNLLKEVFGFSILIFLNMIIDNINWKVDQTIIGIRMSSSAVAVYVAGSKISSLFQRLATSISTVFMPKVTQLIMRGATKEDLVQFMIKVGRMQGMVLLLVFVPYLVIGCDFVMLWLGEGYDEAWSSSIWVMTGLLLVLPQNVALTIMQVMNKYHVFVCTYFFVSIVNVILTWIWVSQYGIVAAAFASCLSYTSGALIFINIYFHKKLELNMVMFWKGMLSIFIVPVILGIGLYIVSRMLPVRTWLMFFVYGMLYTALYALLSWKISLNDSEKQLITGMIKRKR